MSDGDDTTTTTSDDAAAYPFQDPYAGAQPQTAEAQAALDTAYGDFPEARYRAAGADDDTVNLLRAQWAALDTDARGEEGRRVASVSNEALAEEIGVAAGGQVDHPFGKTIADIEAAVGDDPEKARAALDIENASKGPRKTLVEKMQAIVDGAAAAVADAETAGAANGTGDGSGAADGDAGPVNDGTTDDAGNAPAGS